MMAGELRWYSREARTITISFQFGSPLLFVVLSRTVTPVSGTSP